jgi:hypothetical protein
MNNFFDEFAMCYHLEISPKNKKKKERKKEGLRFVGGQVGSTL